MTWIEHMLQMDNSAMCCTDVGTERKTQQRKTQRSMAQDSRERTNGNGLPFLVRGKPGGGWQSVLVEDVTFLAPLSIWRSITDDLLSINIPPSKPNLGKG